MPSPPRKFDLFIAVHQEDAVVYFLEDRPGFPSIITSRTSRVTLDLGRADISGLTPDNLLWKLAHALTDALEQDDRWQFFSS